MLIVPDGLSGGRKELIVPVPGYWVSTAACSCLSWLSVMGHLSQLANRLLRKWSPSHGAGLRGCCRTFFYTPIDTRFPAESMFRTAAHRASAPVGWIKPAPQFLSGPSRGLGWW